MRGLRSTIALFAVLVGLGAYIYFVTWEQEENPGSDREKVFSSLDAESLQEVRVKAESGDTTTVRKEGDSWRIVAPLAAEASSSDVSSLTAALEQLEIVRVVDENPPDLGEYGLASPLIEIEFSASDASGSGRLLVGEQTPTGGNLYAKRGDAPRVFLIPAYQKNSLDQSTFDLRDKTLLDFERAKVEAVDISAGKRSLQFAKRDGDWRLTSPISARADSGTVEGLVSRLETAQVRSVATEEPTAEELKKFGLEPPRASVTLNQGSARATVALGSETDDGAVYARDLSRPTVFTVEKSLADELQKETDDFRRRDAFEFRAFNATRAELTRNGQAVVFERVKGEGENAADSWRRQSPNPAEVDRSKVETLLAGLADIRATSFTQSTSGTGLNDPALVVNVSFEDGKKEERVVFGRSGSNAYFSRPGDPGAAAIEAEKLDEAIKALEELSK